jgi:hypothetical protein
MNHFRSQTSRTASRLRWTTCVAALTAAVLASLAQGPSANGLEPPAVPDNLEVPAGNRPFLLGHAIGTQNYVCLSSSAGFVWTFFGPQATLFNDRARQITTHFLSANPDEAGAARATWQHSRDTSAVWAAAIATSSDPAFVQPGAIPWLLLQVVGANAGPTGGQRLSKTTYIQRVNTSGGLAPTAGCGQASDVGTRALVPYTSDYVFYRATRGD